MRVNQEDKPGVFNLPPPEVQKKVEKLAKRSLKDIIIIIPSIKESIYQPLRIKPYKLVINLFLALKDLSLFSIFSLFITP